MNQPIVHLLIGMRVPADSLFAIGALLYGGFMLRLWIMPRRWVPVAASPAGRNG